MGRGISLKVLHIREVGLDGLVPLNQRLFARNLLSVRFPLPDFERMGDPLLTRGEIVDFDRLVFAGFPRAVASETHKHIPERSEGGQVTCGP